MVGRMSISAYKEITEWDVEYRQPNHTYLFDGKSNILAYAKWHGKEIVIFKEPLPMDTRRRKFVKVKHKELEQFAKTLVLPIEEKPVANNVTSFLIKSDSGKEYFVEKIGEKWSCNCVGFMYRNKCKHSEQVRKENE